MFTLVSKYYTKHVLMNAFSIKVFKKRMPRSYAHFQKNIEDG